MSKILILYASLLSIFLSTTQPAWCRTYVVDTDSSIASDSGPGSSNIPFKTIGEAAKIAVAGDTVLVRPGVYREDVELRNSGTSEKPISFNAEPDGQVIVTGADALEGWTRVPGPQPIYSAPWDHIFAIDWSNGKPVENYPSNAPLWGRAE